MPDIPNVRDYTSNRVFNGVRILIGKEAEDTRARVKRAVEKLKNNRGVSQR